MSQLTTPDTNETPLVCARRQILLGASVGSVALVAAACGGSSSKAGVAAPTTGAPTTDAPSSAAGSSSAPSAAATTEAATGFIAVSKIPTDTAVSVKDPTGRVLLMTQSGGKLTALSSVCTHQGCTVAPAGAKLACPCHGSQYSLTGAVEQGPSVTPLHPVAVKVAGGQVSLA